MEIDRLELIEEMRKKNPNDSFLAYAAALEYQKKGKNTRAISIIEELLKRDPEYLGAYYQLGKLYEEEGDLDKAKKTYKNGKLKAREKQDAKTIGELTEALMFLDEDEDNW